MLPPEDLPKQLSTITSRVKQILLAVPSTRSSDQVLFIEYMKSYCGHILTYSPESQRLRFRNPEGVTYQEFLTQIPSFESIGRLRRFIQAHAKENIEAGIGDEEDAALLPSSKVGEQRAVLAEINSHYYLRN